MNIDPLARQYGLHCLKAEKARAGAGSDTWFLSCAEGKFVLKYPSVSEMNHPELEPRLCEYLNSRGIPASSFIKSRDGGYLSEDPAGRLFHIQRFVEGKMFELNSAPDWLLRESAATLGRIHSALRDYEGLPVGIGEGFFAAMTPDTALASYRRSLETARKNGDAEIESELLYRIGLMGRFPKLRFELSRLSCQASHGDYFISQFICGEERINAVIDWTSACVHPVVWELMRSYVYAAPECAAGVIDSVRLGEYLREYQKYAPLGDYDIQCLESLFFYQLAVCDYYAQYYASTADNREIYLQQARFSTLLMKNHFDK